MGLDFFAPFASLCPGSSQTARFSTVSTGDARVKASSPTRPVVAWYGRLYFAEKLADQGFDVRPLYFRDPTLVTWERVLADCGGPPDVVVLGDRSHAPTFLGHEAWPALTVFYSVDSHIHSWHPVYAASFDACVLSLKNDVPRFAKARRDQDRLVWLPAFAPDELAPHEGLAKEFDVLFAGTVDAATTPRRAAFLKELGELVPGLAVRQGAFEDLFPRARVVLNVAERGDLNFRVFEALALGACLLTPAIGHGQDELFQDMVHLALYPRDDAHAAAARIRELLSDDALRERLARAGRELVRSRHLASHRAAEFARFVRGLDLKAIMADRLGRHQALHAATLKLLYLHWAGACENGATKAAYLAAAKTPGLRGLAG